METTIKMLVTEHGVLALGWVVALLALCGIVYLYRDLRRSTLRHLDNYKELSKAGHDAINNNTQVMTAVKTLLEANGGRRHHE